MVVTLNVSTIDLERRFEVKNNLNKRILEDLDSMGLMFSLLRENDKNSKKVNNS